MLKRVVWMSRSSIPRAVRAFIKASMASAAMLRASDTVLATASTPPLMVAMSGAAVIWPTPVTQMPDCLPLEAW